MIYHALVEKFIFPLSDIILGLSIKKEINIWRSLQWYSADRLEKIQMDRLSKILMHSFNNVPYYSQLKKDIVDTNNYHPLDILKSLPFLTKKIIKDNLPSNIIDKNRKIYYIDRTSGSTGVHGEFYSDKEAYSKTLAIQCLWWEWASYKFGEKSLQTGITPNRRLIKAIKDILFRVYYRPAFDLNDKNILSDLKYIQNKNIKYLMGYASSLSTYAKVSEKYGISDIQLESIISWGDKLYPHYRKSIKRVFNADVYDTYGSCEGTMIAAECENHKYHIMTPHVYIELLDKNGNEVNPGEIGEIFVTRLDNYLMPLIRYKIGDLAIKSNNKKCACNRQLPMLEKIIGRETDIIYTPQGKPLIIHFFTGIFEHFSEINQFQIVDKEDYGIEIRYIPGENFQESILENILNEIYEKADEKFLIQFISVDDIKPTNSGKLQMIIKS